MRNPAVEFLLACNWITPLKAFFDIATKKVTEFTLHREYAWVKTLLKKQFPYWQCDYCDTVWAVRHTNCNQCGHQRTTPPRTFKIQTSNWMYVSLSDYIMFSTPLEHASAVENVLNKKGVWYRRVDA